MFRRMSKKIKAPKFVRKFQKNKDGEKRRNSVELIDVTNLPPLISKDYGRVFYVQLYVCGQRSARAALQACYHHMLIRNAWTVGEHFVIRFQDIVNFKPDFQMLKIKLRKKYDNRNFHSQNTPSHTVIMIDFVHRDLMKRFVEEGIERGLISNTKYTLKTLNVTNTFIKPIYHPNGQLEYYKKHQYNSDNSDIISLSSSNRSGSIY